jgi:hypothetical protein
VGEVSRSGLGGRAFAAVVVAIVAIAVAQSVMHLVVRLGLDRADTLVDLDRSNGLPDLVSTVALAACAVGAAVLAWRIAGSRRTAAAAAAALLAALTVADVMHDGAHPFRRAGPLVIATVLATAALLAYIAVDASHRARITLAVAAVVLGGSFLVTGLDRLEWFDRNRGEPIAEYRVVAKEGLELLGWSLMALALWDEAVRCGPLTSTTARASRAQAPSRRRAV